MKVFNLIGASCIASALLMSNSLVFAGTLTPEDAKIVAAIHVKFSADNSISASKIAVTSHSGLVELTGKVDTESEANQLISLAKSVQGVKKVRSKIQLKKS